MVIISPCNERTSKRQKLKTKENKMNRLNQWRADKSYKAKENLLAHIHNAIAPELEAMRRADDILDRTLRGNEFQGYANLAGCSRLDVYTMGHMKGSESLIPSESFDACAIAGMEAGENNSRNIADNNI